MTHNSAKLLLSGHQLLVFNIYNELRGWLNSRPMFAWSVACCVVLRLLPLACCKCECLYSLARCIAVVPTIKVQDDPVIWRTDHRCPDFFVCLLISNRNVFFIFLLLKIYVITVCQNRSVHWHRWVHSCSFYFVDLYRAWYLCVLYACILLWCLSGVINK